LFINAVQEVTRERAQSFLKEEHIQKILAAYQSFIDIEGFTYVATLDEVRAKEANLNIPLYVRSNGTGNGAIVNDEISLEKAIADWQQSSQVLRTSMNDLFAMLEEAGFGN
ncbi:MAG TPA: N-6 DNA methylase, partial [Ktedonobacteraceae bacterium]|nr:N-6 DNA methylase [Ktedonobacteraceae bacterium]